MLVTRVVGGTIVTPAGRFDADLVLAEGKVAAMTEPGHAGSSDVEIDARGKLVFSGFIDPHIHSRDPGLTEKEDFSHSTLAAVCGGVTTVLEMPNDVPPVTDATILDDRAVHYSSVAFTDFGLWGMSLGAENLGQIPGLVAAGAVGVKLFWCYAYDRATCQIISDLALGSRDGMITPPSSREVFDLFRVVASSGGLVAAHCEDRGVLEASAAALGHEVRAYGDLLAARPEVAEVVSIGTGAEFAQATNCRFHVVHVSSARGAEVVRRARRDGIRITAETCPQYLTLSELDHAEVGSIMKVYPPVRTAADAKALGAAVQDGTISSIGSDHAPHTIDQKDQGLAAAPAGAIGAETLVPLMLNEAVSGRIGWERLAAVLSQETARIYGLYPQKGSLMPGADADLAIVDPERTWAIDNRTLHSKQSLSPWQGRRGCGQVVAAVLRGELVMQDGEPLREPRGRWVRPCRRGCDVSD